MTYIRFFFVLYWFAPFLKFGPLLSENPRCALGLLEFSKRSTFVIAKSYTFNTKTTFPLRSFLNIFSFKMFPKCFLNARNIATLREHSAKIPEILRAGWVPSSISSELVNNQKMKKIKINQLLTVSLSVMPLSKILVSILYKTKSTTTCISNVYFYCFY